MAFKIGIDELRGFLQSQPRLWHQSNRDLPDVGQAGIDTQPAAYSRCKRFCVKPCRVIEKKFRAAGLNENWWKSSKITEKG